MLLHPQLLQTIISILDHCNVFPVDTNLTSPLAYQHSDLHHPTNEISCLQYDQWETMDTLCTTYSPLCSTCRLHHSKNDWINYSCQDAVINNCIGPWTSAEVFFNKSCPIIWNSIELKKMAKLFATTFAWNIYALASKMLWCLNWWCAVHTWI